MTRAALVALVVAIMTATPSAIATDDHAPSTVEAIVGVAKALVSWVPGPTPADEYRVYGANGGIPTLLAVVDGRPVEEFVAAVDSGYTTYAVSGVRDGTESRLVFAGEIHGDCIMVSYDPPAIIYDTDCLTGGVSDNPRLRGKVAVNDSSPAD